jgi:endonuclease/exonuclease/phosphatase family metal-dependent hydrolase
MIRRLKLGVCTSSLALFTIAFLSVPQTALAQLPGGWSSTDVGDVGVGGYAGGVEGSFAVIGGGADIWGTADGFHFVYRTLTGDGEIIARVDGVDYAHAWSKGGVMMRSSLNDGSAHAYMLGSAGKGTAFQRRSAASGQSSHTPGGGWVGSWVRLTRSGNSFDAYESWDGYNWNWVGSEWIDMPQTIYVGLAVTSHSYGSLAGASFSHTMVNEWGGNGGAAVADISPIVDAAPLPSGSTLRVLHWNTQHLRGSDGVFDPNRTAYWIARANADIISLNEIDDDWMADVITQAVTAQTGQQWSAFFSGWGNLILTRLPVTGRSVCEFNPGAGRKAAHMGVWFNGRTINLWSAHLGLEGTDTRIYEVSNLWGCANGWDEARIIAGDFNMQQSSAEYGTIAAGFADAWAIARQNGTAYNYSGNCDGCTRNSRIDYIFSSWGAWFLSVQSAEMIDTRDGYGYMASDHKPMVVTYQVQ